MRHPWWKFWDRCPTCKNKGYVVLHTRTHSSELTAAQSAYVIMNPGHYYYDVTKVPCNHD